MRHIRNLSVIILLAIVATGCATATRGIPVGGGWRMSLGFESNVVVVTNATGLPGDLIMNGGFVTTIPIGETFTVSLGGFVRNNVLIFKAFSLGPTGEKILRAVETGNFQGGAGDTREWTIRYVQPIR